MKNIVEVYSQAQFIADVERILNVATVGEALEKVVTISKGINEEHELVLPIQRYFNSQGFDCGEITGRVDEQFIKACKQYQACYGLTSNGEITANENIWRKLLGII